MNRQKEQMWQNVNIGESAKGCIWLFIVFILYIFHKFKRGKETKIWVMWGEASIFLAMWYLRLDGSSLLYVHGYVALHMNLFSMM